MDLRTNKGFSLIEILIASAFMFIVIMALAESNLGIQKQIRLLEQKQELVDFKNIIIQHMSKANVCGWQMAQPTITISTTPVPTQAAPSSSVIDFAELRQGPDASSALLVRAGEALPSTQLGIRISSIQFKNIYSTGNPDEYRGTLEIVPDPESLIMALRPVQVGLVIKTVAADPAGAKHIQSCNSDGTSLTAPTTTTVFCDTYRSGCSPTVPDGRCPIPNSENAVACFLTGVDDDTGRVGSAGTDGLPFGHVQSSRTYDRVSNTVDDLGNSINNTAKCEVAPNPSGTGWYARAWFDCELLMCNYACIFK